MTGSAHPLRGPDGVSLTVDYSSTAGRRLPHVRDLYRSIYADPPYCEGEADVADFVRTWPGRQRQPDFRLVVAWRDSDPIGFAFGHELVVGTRWWSGLNGTLSDDTSREYDGRTFALIELAVLQQYRGKGIARELHAHVLAGLAQERVTLLVRREAAAAQHAYKSWGYECVGQVTPFEDSPTYDAMIMSLHRGPRGG